MIIPHSVHAHSHNIEIRDIRAEVCLWRAGVRLEVYTSFLAPILVYVNLIYNRGNSSPEFYLLSSFFRKVKVKIGAEMNIPQ
jgi:hypothetical protein